MKIPIKKSKEEGFALLFAVLVSSVLLSIGISIFNITLKELILSSAGRESQFAFYSADTGAECALYWDFKESAAGLMFATSSVSLGGWRDSQIAAENPQCIGVNLVPQFVTPANVTSNSAETRFELEIPNNDYQGASAPYCAIVSVYKTESAGLINTIVDSRGYNTECNSTSVNRVERALRVTY